MLSVNRPALRFRDEPVGFAPLACAARASLQGRMQSFDGASPHDAHVRDILAIARAQDRAAFARLFGHFGPRVKSYLLRLGADQGQAEDLTQEVMLALWRKAPAYDPRLAAPSTWIFAIARNRRIDVLRRERRPDPEMLIFMQENNASSAESEMERSAFHGRLHASLTQVSANQLDILKKAYFEDLSHSEIAQQLGLPLGTVKSRIRLALIRLRGLLDDEDTP